MTPALDAEERELRLNQNQAHIKQSQEQLADLQQKQKELQAQQDYRQYEQQAMLRSRILRMEELIEDLNSQPKPELTTENLANVIEQWTGFRPAALRRASSPDCLSWMSG